MTIQHRSGKSNNNADALSRFPLPTSADINLTGELIAAVTASDKEDGSGADGTELAALQRADKELAPILEYLDTGILPVEVKLARKIALTGSQYMVQGEVLYRVEDDGTLRVIAPELSRRQLFVAAHGGKFGAHLSDLKVYSELRRHYWWAGMRRDVSQWTRACLVCATRSTGRLVKPPLTPIPVSGPSTELVWISSNFLALGAGMIRIDTRLSLLITSLNGPRSMQYRISRQLLWQGYSWRKSSADMASPVRSSRIGVELLMGYHKVNTTAYHPQTDGLVERYNRTLTAMLAKTVGKDGPEWDERLPYVLFAYRASQQSSTQESPFYLLYGRDPRLPVPAALSPEITRVTINLNEYGLDLHTRMAQAWDLARASVGRAQRRQKVAYDQKTREPSFREGERVFLYKPAEKTGENRKFARPFHGPYRVMEMSANTAKILRVDRPWNGYGDVPKKLVWNSGHQTRRQPARRQCRSLGGRSAPLSQVHPILPSILSSRRLLRVRPSQAPVLGGSCPIALWPRQRRRG